MPLESPVYISDLVPANPVVGDPISQGQSHIQLIKQVLKATFPNITGAVLASHTDLPAGLPAAVSALQSNRIRNDIDQTVVGSLMNVTAGKVLDFPVVKQNGSQLLPTGCIIMWSGAVSAIPAGWHLCDGTAGTPDLRDRFVGGAGNLYAPGATGGGATFTNSTSSAGAHAHGSATGNGGAHSHGGATDLQGLHVHSGATGQHVLSIAEIPPHSHPLNGHWNDSGDGTSFTFPSGGGGVTAYRSSSTNAQGSGVAHNHTIPSDGVHQHNLSTNAAPDHVHPIAVDGTHNHVITVGTLPPFYALCFIFKL